MGRSWLGYKWESDRFRNLFKGRGKGGGESRRSALYLTTRNLPRACLLGQMSTDMYDVVSDHPKSDPALDSVRPFIERSTQPMPAFENTDAAFTAGAPLLKFLKPPLLLPLFACGALSVVARNRDPADSHLMGLGFVSG